MASLYSFIWITVCILLQVMVFDHLHFYGSIVLVYLLPLMKMPVQIGRSFQIFLGFLCGLIVDIFSNSIGMHALTCTFTMWMRLPLLHMFIVSDEIKKGIPGLKKLGLPIFVKYSATVIAIHTILLYLIESFSMLNLLPMLLRILVTFLLTLLFIVAYEFALYNKK